MRWYPDPVGPIAYLMDLVCVGVDEQMKSSAGILLAAFLMLPCVAQACPCLALEADGFARAKMVFTGQVVSVEDLGSQHQGTTFRILSSDKGPGSGEVKVVSENRRDTGCSAQFEIGQRYKVFTYPGSYLDLTTFKTVEVPNYTNACSRSGAE